MDRKGVWFVSDVHLGLRTADPDEREERFVGFLKSIPDDSKAVYLLGDIWDFWYEYHDVVPKTGTRTIAQLLRLMEAGVQVFFCPGNHDIWTYSYFESLGIKRITQPFFVEIDGKQFCLGHGDGLGGSSLGYRILQAIFHSRFLQMLFSTIHPGIAFRFGLGWSGRNRKAHKPYRFRNQEEPLYHFAEATAAQRRVDYFIFGHFHTFADIPVGKSRLLVLHDWISGGTPHIYYDGENLVNIP